MAGSHKRPAVMTIDHSQIRVTVQEFPRWRRTLSFEVPAEIVRGEHARALEALAGRLQLPGFRKGRIPPAAIERYGPGLVKETLDRVIDEAFRSAVEELGLRPVSKPEVEGVAYQPASGLTFRVSLDVQPVVQLSRLEGFRVERPRARVEEKEVEEALRRVLAENAVWRAPEEGRRPQDGDLVTVRIERLEDDGDPALGDPVAPPTGPEGRRVADVGLPWARRLRLRPDSPLGTRFQFVLGEGDAVPALEDAIRSLAPGQAGVFEVGAEAGTERALRLRVALEDWRMRELPELDDVFAESLGVTGGVAGLRVHVRAALEAEAREQAEEQLRTRLLDSVLAANPFEVPISMVRRYIDSRLGDTAEADPQATEEARSELWPAAEAAVKRLLAVERIAEERGLRATPEEVEARIEEIARAGDLSPDQVRSRLVETRRLDALAKEVTEAKVTAFLESRAEVLERP